MGHLSSYFEDKNQIRSTDRLHWLDTLLELVFQGSDINAVDSYGQTPLHLAAHNGLPDAVNVLLQRNASLENKNEHGETPLEVAIKNTPTAARPFVLATKIADLRKALHDHEMVAFLLLYYGASFEECKRSGSSMLHRAIINQQLYIVQLLLLKGASLTCKDSLGQTPLVTYLHSGGYRIDEVLRDFTVSISIECGKPFNSSAFHLLSYRPPTSPYNNFFYSWKCNEREDPACNVKKGPLAEAIESHTRRQEIISSCLDVEGFTPLHRAAQGANVVSVRYLVANSANDSILSPHGHDALTLAVLHSKDERHGNFFYEEGQAEEAATELLHHAMKSRGYRIRCDSSKAELTLYHLAASRGLLNLIEVIFNERDLHQVDVNCPNSDGITPMYLAKLFDSGIAFGNPWKQVVQIIESHGGEMRYPEKDAEYYVMYRLVYGWILNEFTLRPDITHFITSLLTSYEKNENKSFHCSFDQFNQFEQYFSLASILQEILTKVAMKELSDEDQSRYLNDIVWCSGKRNQLFEYFGRLEFHGPIYRERIFKSRIWETFNKEQRSWFQKQIFTLMKLRHKEIENFACVKSLSYRLKPLLDAKKMRVLLRQYKKSQPYFYLNSICRVFRAIENYSLISRMSRMSRFTFHGDDFFGYSAFFEERMKVSKYTLHDSSLISAWPLEFLVKRLHGVFRRYDYLKTLHVGGDPSIHLTQRRTG